MNRPYLGKHNHMPKLWRSRYVMVIITMHAILFQENLFYIRVSKMPPLKTDFCYILLPCKGLSHICSCILILKYGPIEVVCETGQGTGRHVRHVINKK